MFVRGGIRYLLLLLLLAGSANADSWPDVVHDNIDLYEFPYQNPYLASAWGTCVEYELDFDNEVQFSYINVRHKNLRKKLKLAKLLQVDSMGEPTSAPVVFYLSGAFAEIKGNSNTNQMLKRFSRAGYHVLAFPSPWGKDFIKAIPNLPLGHIEKEAQTLYEIIKRQVSSMRKKGLTNDSPRLVGLSQGGFVSTVIAALDSKSKTPIRFKDVTIFSAPFDLNQTMKLLDQDLDETVDLYTTTGLLNLYKRYKELCRLDGVSKPSQQVLDIVQMLTAWYGFQALLVDSMELYDRKIGLKGPTIPTRSRGDSSEVIRHFRENVRFSSFLKTYFPSSYRAIKGDHGKLTYWIEMAYKNGFYDLRYLASNDDFLNHSGVWNTPLELDVVVTEHGGHFGFKGQDWFQDIFNASF